MGNVKESMRGAESNPSNQPESQGSIISEQVGQQHVHKSRLENHFENKSFLSRNRTFSITPGEV